MLWELFINFIKIGLFSFGGGYAAIPLIQDIIINQYHWMESETFNDILAISQMTPGPIGINASTFVGLQLDGLRGACVATIAFIIPSFILAMIFGKLYLKYNNLNIVKNVLNKMKPVIIAIIFSAGLVILQEALFVDSNIDYLQVAFFILAFFLSAKFKLSPVLVMLIVGFGNWLLYLIF